MLSADDHRIDIHDAGARGRRRSTSRGAGLGRAALEAPPGHAQRDASAGAQDDGDEDGIFLGVVALVGVDVVEEPMVLEVVGLPGMYGAGTSPAEPMATASRAQRLPWFEVDAVLEER